MSKTYNCPTFLFTYLISLPISSSSWAMCRILKLKPPCQPDSKHLLVHELCTLSVSSPVCCCVHWLQSCPNPGDPMDCSPPGSSVHGVLQARRKRHLGALLGTSQIQGSYGEGEFPKNSNLSWIPSLSWPLSMRPLFGGTRKCKSLP